jgi:hypothetical protein
MAYPATVADPAPNRSLVSWGSVFAGALIAFAVMTLLTLLWLGVNADGSVSSVSAHLNWYLAGSAILATLLAGFFSAWLARDRGFGVGITQALTEWGLLTLAVVIIAPGVVTAFRALVSAAAISSTRDIYWTSFWAILIGLGTALVGGIIGGLLPSPMSPRTVLLPRDAAPVDDRPAVIGDRARAT